MSSTAKPNVQGLGAEINYTIISSHVSSGTSAYGLFDGTTPNEWNTNRVCYWLNSSNYIEINISQLCNIWRCGTQGWLNSKGPLQIFRYNGTSYDDITSLYPQTLTSITNSQWEKTISKLPKGQYKFVGTSYRIDSEWYVETFNKFLIQDGNNLCNTDGNALQTQDILPYTIDKFNTYGMDDLININKTVISKINNNKYNIAMLK